MKPKNQKEVAELLNNSRNYGSITLTGSLKEQKEQFREIRRKDRERLRNEIGKESI
ncbi:hypothetical protein [Escherichia coli]|uniref:hypothetical protein n=1 Tax=Escherichia coli TaxID=562 RepID=UPI0002CB5FCC|nr:hypothetical protein [Escherichia coli]EMU81219.1 hypothetical protein ECMP0210179_1504 [Escherichia coli MP021017.9]EMU83427.1 hypothetical protein ECMP0210176_1549 [Escherichia coli MP021017.6]EMU85696.1 hypothetical protein ECMP0210175_1535 [Escherichia coli MP021017.5]EMU96254.1 hypothetical protein ECMP0210174_1462 [Escherichia coli MP021017.4]EMU97538.1 hypothetical protein ECMP0210173_1564 [Escherichia coli MP021017.3]